MPYEVGDKVNGIIFKDGVELISLNGAVLIEREDGLVFESSVKGIPPLKAGDTCQLVYADFEADVMVVSVATGAPFSQIFFRFA